MTLDEAIKHCLEVAEQNDAQAEKWREEGGEEWGKTTACRECAADHRQLAEWLTEYRQLSEENQKQKEQIAEYKRLLKSAFDEWHIVCEWGDCSERCDWFENGKCTQEWRYKAEALKLIES